jgi:hypothetical protein
MVHLGLVVYRMDAVSCRICNRDRAVVLSLRQLCRRCVVGAAARALDPLVNTALSMFRNRMLAHVCLTSSLLHVIKEDLKTPVGHQLELQIIAHT